MGLKQLRKSKKNMPVLKQRMKNNLKNCTELEMLNNKSDNDKECVSFGCTGKMRI